MIERLCAILQPSRLRPSCLVVTGAPASLPVLAKDIHLNKSVEIEALWPLLRRPIFGDFILYLEDPVSMGWQLEAKCLALVRCRLS